MRTYVHTISLQQAVVMADEESELSFTVNSEGKLFKFESMHFTCSSL